MSASLDAKIQPNTTDTLLVEAIERADSAKTELLKQRERIHRLEHENQLLNKFLEDGKRDFELFQQVEKRMSDKVRAQEEEILTLRAELESRGPGEDERRDRSSELRRLREAEESLHHLCKTQQAEVVAMAEERAELQQTIAALQCSLDAANQKIESLNNRMNQDKIRAGDERVFRRQVAQFMRDERRLKFYALSLQREKQTIVETAKELSRRILDSRAVNPLRDYLDVTEFEARKIEIQLKTTPMISPTRPSLESALAKVIEQRDFLRKLISSSDKELDAQSATLARIIEQENSAFVPPPPPKVRDV